MRGFLKVQTCKTERQGMLRNNREKKWPIGNDKISLKKLCIE